MKYIIGIGNYSMGDDSIGLRLVEYIAEHGLDKDFMAIDLSSNYLNLFTYLNPETKKILIIDCALMGKAPGEYAFFTPDEVGTDKSLSPVSTHQGDLLKVLQLARETQQFMPKIMIMGIVPVEIKEKWELSAVLQEKLPEYAQAAIDYISIN